MAEEFSSHLPERHLRHPLGKAERRHALAIHAALRRDVHEHHHLGLAAEAVLQQLRELAVAEGDVAAAGGQGRHHVAQRAQAAVDVLGLDEAVA